MRTDLSDKPNSGQPSRAFSALLPEVPVEAEEQAIWLALFVGAIVFSGIMGWGPHGRWLAASSSTAKPKALAVALPRDGGSASSSDRVRAATETVGSTTVAATAKVAAATKVVPVAPAKDTAEAEVGAIEDTLPFQEPVVFDTVAT